MQVSKRIIYFNFKLTLEELIKKEKEIVKTAFKTVLKDNPQLLEKVQPVLNETKISGKQQTEIQKELVTYKKPITDKVKEGMSELFKSLSEEDKKKYQKNFNNIINEN